MKKLAKMIMVLMLVMGMCACTPKPEQPKETIYEVIGITFADKTTVNDDLRSTLTLYKEGDFELFEYIDGKLSLVRGDYKQRDNEYDLYPQNCKALPEKVVFRATSAEEMILDTDLVISSFGDVFVPEATLPKKETSEYPMIFYSTVKGENDLGTTTLELYEDGTLCEEMFAQTGTSDYKPKHYEYRDFISPAEFSEKINQADIVVSHGASGSIMKALNAGKKVIAVTRLEKYGEHINNHQIQNNVAFSSNGYVLAADNELTDLGDCFQKIYAGTDGLIPWENKDPMAIVNMIDGFIQENWKK